MSFLAVDTAAAVPVTGLLADHELAGEARSFADLREVLQALERSLEPGAETARALVARASAIVVGVGSRPAAPVQGGLAPWQARKLRRHIDENLDGTLTTAVLGELVALSASYFGRAFKATFGETPHAYITRRRLEAAKDLMLSTREPLSQIAYQCGFADQSHLCRLFRRSAGVAPQAWRRANRMAA
ncbi:helix-turn-helix domain-containing protein [Caulobacter endophyticus]|uniref:helix-turn-helix domain-containing protein n=1 Tax=Caulobacter endophyticus TaxID=2172652 RepID=UPI00240EEAFC|nr:AraC family transcriptional regulator [Caulobacter endophyticus]MDG2531373.1 AraC family transcriptional regulator [Caulobacter endophyticus]